MTTRVTAVYENGVLRLTSPLPLTEGQTVRVTVEAAADLPRPTEDELIRRIEAATTLDELFAVLNAAPEEDDGYDLLEALNENRRRGGERLQFSQVDTIP